MSRDEKMMNCDDYKQAVTAEPGFEDTSGHVQGCAECHAYREEMVAMNDNIIAAMQVRVPELKMPELPDIETDNVVALARRRSVSTPVWLAIAASVVLAVFLGVRTGDSLLPEVSLAEQVLAHVDHEPAALLPSSVAIEDGKLQRVVPKNIATMNHDAGLITYAETCPVNGKDVPHLVIQGKNGPITILLMPNEKISANEELNGENVHGYLLQVGDGSIAIIGERDEALDDVKEKVLNSVAWDI